MTARDLFTHTPSDEPAADVQDRQRTGHQPDRKEGEPLPLSGASGALEPSRARALGTDGELGTCGTCASWTAQRETGFGSCEHRRPWTLTSSRATCVLEPVLWAAVESKKLAQRGIDQAVAAADRSIAGWSDCAFDFIRLWAAANSGKRVIGHDIVQASIAAGITQPPNSKAWGGPIQRAARVGWLKRVGHADDPNRHGNPVPLWEAT